MINRMDMKRRLLNNLLAPLVKEWGMAEVRRALADLAGAKPVGLTRKGGKVQIKSNLNPRNIRDKPDALEIFSSFEVPVEKMASLKNIAMAFQQKTFLPTLADVKDFLEMEGVISSSIKNRIDGFRKLLPLVAKMSDEQIKRLSKNAFLSAPAELGPLADAIKATSQALREGKID